MGGDEMLTRILRSNWHLISLLVLIAASAVVMAMRPEAADTAEAMAVDTEVAVNLTDAQEAVQSRWSQATRDQRVQEAIDEYERELRENRDSSDTPANLYRLANLYYSKVHDYEKASLYYEALIQEFPDYQGLQTVYPNLAVCYERLGRHDLKRNTYRRMMEYYPDHSQEYAFAKQELGL